MTTTVRTRVAIVGAGPAGLLLSHLLGAAGIDSVLIDQRTRDEIETTIRAGILEQGTVEILDASGASSRVRTMGHRHDGIELRFGGEGHRIDFAALVGRGVARMDAIKQVARERGLSKREVYGSLLE